MAIVGHIAQIDLGQSFVGFHWRTSKYQRVTGERIYTHLAEVGKEGICGSAWRQGMGNFVGNMQGKFAFTHIPCSCCGRRLKKRQPSICWAAPMGVLLCLANQLPRRLSIVLPNKIKVGEMTNQRCDQLGITAPLDRRDGRLIQGLMRTSSLSLEEWQMLWVDEGAEC